MNKNRKRLVIVLSIVLFIIVVFFGGRLFIYRKIASTIESKLGELKEKGYRVSYDSLIANSWSGKVSLRKLIIQFPASQKECADSTTMIRANMVDISGLSIIMLILKREINLDRVHLTSSFIRYGRIEKQDSSKSKKQGQPLNGITISHLDLDSTTIEIRDSASCKVKTVARFSLSASSLSLTAPGTPAADWSIGQMMLSGLNLKFPQKFYTLKLQTLKWDRNAKSLRADSIKIMPDYEKDAFMKKTGIQTDRVSGSIPMIEISGIMPVAGIKNGVKAAHANLSLDLLIFRDKRYPFVVYKNKELPARAFHDLGFKIQIDTLNVAESNIEYDEFPEEGAKAGVVTFNHLRAHLYKLSNFSGSDILMDADAKFMNAGDLHAEFTFPQDPAKASTLKGSLSRFNMMELNRILIPAANAEVKKGMLEEMNFNFQYNDYRSDGQLTMHYTDLDLVSLSKKEHKTNKFLTAILQAFIVKKDMDKNKSQGTILWYRDQQRAIFNYWWKSILSGVKSVYNLDKILDTHHAKKK